MISDRINSRSIQSRKNNRPDDWGRPRNPVINTMLSHFSALGHLAMESR